MGYEKYYEVSNLGRIRSLNRITNRINRWGKPMISKLLGREIVGCKNSYNYSVVTLSIGGLQKIKRIHVLVATSFLPNPELKETVNHKDGDKSNNFVSNLEWATMKEQNIHSYETGLKKARKEGEHYRSRLVLNINTGIFYDSAKMAARAHNKNYNTAKKQINKGDKNLIYA